ncbi:MAG: hypothetical protein OHK0046_22810 [Anaerolineae bacterium]
MRLLELALHTDQPERLHSFYAETLGLPRITAADDLIFQVGATKLSFQRSATPHRYHFAFNIPNNQFDAAKAWIKARVPLIPIKDDQDEIDFTSWNAKSLYFFDPAGNVLEFIARYGLENACDDAFDSSGLLNISEIGLGTPDVQRTVQEIQTHLGYPVFDGEGSTTFCAIGNDEGLFIVVPEGREWFPFTGVTAGLCPLTAVVEADTPQDLPLSGTPYRIVAL